MDLATDTPKGPVGRPRSTEADDAIAHAALSLLAEAGFEGVTVEAVAQRAGVARTTVYRRYPGKPELLVTVLAHACRAPVDDPDTGSVVGDLTAVAEGLAPGAHLHRPRPGPARGHRRGRPAPRRGRRPSHVRGQSTPGLPRRRGPGHRAWARSIPAVDPDTLVDLVVGPVFHRRFMSRRPVGDGWIAEIVTRAVRACAPTGSPSRRGPNGD